MTVSVFGRFTVRDFVQFRQVFDRGAESRRQNDVVSEKLMRDPDNPNVVMVWYEYEDEKMAKAYVARMNSDQLHESPPVKQGGVLPETVETWIGKDI